MIKKLIKHPLTSVYIAQGQKNGLTREFIRSIKDHNYYDLPIQKCFWYTCAGISLCRIHERQKAVNNLNWYRRFLVN